MQHTNTINIAQKGRADKVISNELGISRNQIEKLISSGLININGKKLEKPSTQLEAGDIVEYTFIEAERSKGMKVDFDVDIIYEDDHILVVNKPTNLVVHDAPSVKEATLVDWLKSKNISLSTLNGEERHGIVHRIDKDTTGALVIAKTNESHEALSKQLEDKTMGRYYVAIIDYPLKEDITIEANIARSPANRLKMAIVENGRYAKSAFAKLIEGKNSIELIAAKLFTGRTHQIRVHLASIGRHILGDTLYGYRGKEIPRVFLHARLIYFKHPVTNEFVEFEAPLHKDMKGFLDVNFDEKYKKLLTKESIKGAFDASH